VRVKRRHRQDILRSLALGLVIIFCLFPIIMIVVTSLKTRVVAMAMPPVWIFRPTLDNYTEIFSMYDFALYFKNSIIAASVSTLVAVVLGAPAAYVLARYSFRAKENLAFWILSQRMTPAIAAIIPLFILLRTVRLLDTLVGLIIVYTTFNLPFLIWMMRGFFEDLPIELEESAMVDGCSRYGAFFRVALVLAAPGLAAAAIFTFLFTWNEFLFALILTGTQARTMPVAVQLFMRETGIDWTHMCAAAVVMMIPMLIFTLFIQRYLVRGLTFGAVKG
jgi:multiple sugar transport system permease protein